VVHAIFLNIVKIKIHVVYAQAISMAYNVNMLKQFIDKTLLLTAFYLNHLLSIRVKITGVYMNDDNDLFFRALRKELFCQ